MTFRRCSSGIWRPRRASRSRSAVTFASSARSRASSDVWLGGRVRFATIPTGSPNKCLNSVVDSGETFRGYIGMALSPERHHEVKGEVTGVGLGSPRDRPPVLPRGALQTSEALWSASG